MNAQDFASILNIYSRCPIAAPSFFKQCNEALETWLADTLAGDCACMRGALQCFNRSNQPVSRRVLAIVEAEGCVGLEGYLLALDTAMLALLVDEVWCVNGSGLPCG